MLYLFIILNLVAIIFSIILLYSVSGKYKKLFIIGCLLPLILWLLVALFNLLIVSDDITKFGIQEIFFFLLRGGLILSVLSGILACYLGTKYRKIFDLITRK